MNHLLEVFARARGRTTAACWRAAGALSLALLTTACGPGTGGTGVGPITGVYVTDNVTGGTTSGLSATSVASASDFLLSFASDGIRIEGVCWAFSAEGAWIEVDGSVRVIGSYRSGPAGTDLTRAAAMPATLVARTEPAGLLVTLLDTNGATLASFAPARRVADGVVPTAPAPCVSVVPRTGRAPG